jgi:hypothetical protein
MDYRAELVRMIAEGTPPADIVYHLCINGLERWQVDELLHECGVKFLPIRRPDDDITPERRAELLGISMADD